jgi:hypothetical protein
LPLFRSAHDGPPAPANAVPPAEDDSPTALLRLVFDANRYINRNSGHLPGEGVVNARRLTDTLREIIDTSQTRPLDVYATVAVKSILDDYLPTTLKTYLAVDGDATHVALSSGNSPAQALVEQLGHMQTSAVAVLAAARTQDANALITQGNFLSTKFTRSDLDL